MMPLKKIRVKCPTCNEEFSANCVVQEPLASELWLHLHEEHELPAELCDLLAQEVVRAVGRAIAAGELCEDCRHRERCCVLLVEAAPTRTVPSAFFIRG